MRLAACIWVLSLGLFIPPPVAASELSVSVIVNSERSDELSLSDVRAIYLKQKRFWNDGTAIVPVNREAGTAVREAFSKKVFQQSSHEMATYWNQRYFEAGEFPPATLASDEAVVRFVAGNANAIGYVAFLGGGQLVRVVVLAID